MKGFRYSYQKIIDLKSSEKSQAEWVLSSALTRLQAEEMSLSELRMTRQEWESKQLHSAQAGVSLSELQTVQHYLDYIDSCIEKKALDVRRAEGAVSLSRSGLSDKVKAEKVWLRAKDTAQQRFRYTAQLKEQNELDELATVRYLVQAQ
ncbi:flagellar export protein FliJ [Paenibacillus sp. GCM10023252]|uniref:flagellar export protein FliJ n=1 Tax=Paenibacillus sp. GCM10023252 TaxID=3252649 RepID=UPI00361A7955